VFGYLDLTRGTYTAEANVALVVNPIWKRHFKEMKEIQAQNKQIEKQNEQILQYLKRGWN